MKMKMKRIMGFFLALVIFMGYLPLNPTASYANGNVEINDTNFEDEIFRNYVKDNFDKDKDNYLSQDELNKVKNIYIYGQSVSSLKGIEYFKNLTKLYCYENKLRSLDLRENTKLIELDCNKNKLTKLDISKNKNLTILNCISNKLTSLDVRENTKLIDLFCSYNKLTKLDISKNKNLTKFYCDHNKLTSLDISKNKNLTNLRCDNNKLRSLDLRNNTNLTRLYCSENKLESLDISKNKNLTNLWCYNNNLTSLDLRNNTNLTKLYCYENNLTSLDVSKNTKIFGFYCRNQQYKITVIKGIREFKYSEFPGQFDKDKVTSQVGASFGTDALTVDSDDTNKVTYKYKVDDNREMDVTLNVTYFDPENVESMVVKEQPKKLSYTEGEKLDLSGLVVTLTDNQGLTKDVEFKDFGAYKITTNPIDGTALTLENNRKGVKLTKGLLTAQTNALTVKAKVTPLPSPTPTDPAIVGPVDLTDPNGGKPADTSKYWTVTFKADSAKGTMGTKNTFYVLKNSGKTLADLAKDAPKVTAKAGFKFTGWEPALDANTTINKDMTVNAKFEKVAVTPAPKNPPVVGTEDPTQPGKKPQVANNKALPKTANSMNIELYTFLMILSAGLFVVAFKRKKES